MQIKLVFTRKVVHLASFWRWGFLELGSGLFTGRNSTGDVMLLQLTNRTVRDISRRSRRSICQSFFFTAWIYNIIQIHSGETSRPLDVVARSVFARPHALKHASLSFKNLWEVDLTCRKSNVRRAVLKDASKQTVLLSFWICKFSFELGGQFRTLLNSKLSGLQSSTSIHQIRRIQKRIHARKRLQKDAASVSGFTGFMWTKNQLV